MAEVRVAPDRLLVTVALPNARLGDVVLMVTRSTLHVQSLPGRGALNLVYPLPMAAEPGAFVARELNGVLDVVILRVSRRSV